MELDKVRKDLKELRDAGFIDCNIQCFLDKLEKVTEKIVVDQFVADWYEKYKDNLEYSIWEWMRYEPNKEKNKEFYLWLNSACNNPVETIVKMKLFGYSVKKEERYIIRVKDVYHNSNCLNYYGDKTRWVFVDDIEGGSHRTKHTKKQLKDAGFGWVFSCPGIEVEEVEE